MCRFCAQMYKAQKIKKNMFPKFTKLHAMQTRKPHKLIIQHAKTERFKKSAKIYMQQILNDQDINF